MSDIVEQVGQPKSLAWEFDEAWYLKKYLDVAAAVQRRGFRSGFEHFEKIGRERGRFASEAHFLHHKAAKGPIRETKPLLKYPLFIVGSPRSGTSILVQALRAVGYAGYNEGNLLSLLRTLDVDIDRHFTAFGSENPLVLSKHITAPFLKDRIYGAIRDAIDEHYKGAAWLDKTGNPEMIEAIPILRKLWPNSRFIFAKRRAIENIASRLKKFPNFSFEYHCSDWARNMSTWRRAIALDPTLPHVEIDQWDMGNTPTSAAEKLAAFLEMSAEQRETLEEIFSNDRPQQTEAGSATTLHTLQSVAWTDAQKEIFKTKCMGEMAAFRYSVDADYWANP